MGTHADAPEAPAAGRREQLLAAARTVLSEHGYERATVSSIATRANVAQGTFYLYFPSKEALPGALAEQMSQALGAAIARATDGVTSLDEAIDRLVEVTFSEGEEFADVLLIANRGIELSGSWEQWLEVTAAWRRALEDMLGRLCDAGAIDRDLDIANTALVIRDLLDRAMKARVVYGQDEYARATATLVRRALAP